VILFSIFVYRPNSVCVFVVVLYYQFESLATRMTAGCGRPPEPSLNDTAVVFWTLRSASDCCRRNSKCQVCIAV
jgi:hypothetical protein